MDPAAFMVLEGRLAMVVDKPAVAPGQEWQHIDCSSKTAYGCGKYGQGLLEGMKLYVRRVNHPDLTSSISVHLSEEALRSVEADLGVPRRAVDAMGAVKLATEQLLILVVAFRLTTYNERVYCLVYDSTDASLYMVPFIPDDFVPSYTAAPVPSFTGAGRDHELVVMARTFRLRVVDGDLLCVSTPVARANSGSDDGTTGMWRVMLRRFPGLPYGFKVDVLFSSEGKVFWVDLWQGLVCCDLRARRDDSIVEQHFINLPHGYLAHRKTESGRFRRTMACIDGSIKFVSIDPRSRHGNQMVRMWALDLDQQSWKEEEGFPFPLKKLLEQVHFMDAAELRGVRPQYPILLPDGALCLLLPNTLRRKRAEVAGDYLSCFDMRTKRLQWFGRVHYFDLGGSVMVPCNFFTKSCAHPSKRQLPTLKRKLRSSSSQMPISGC